MSFSIDFKAAYAAGTLKTVKVETATLLRLTRFPTTEPYWGKSKTYRFDDPAQSFGVTYAAQSLQVAFAETILHQKASFDGKEWVIDVKSLEERHIVQYTRPIHSQLVVADLTGLSLKSLGLNNDLCASDDYSDAMALSRALHEQVPELDGILYVSRQLNTSFAVAIFERSGVQVRANAVRLIEHSDYGQLLTEFNVAVIPRGRAPVLTKIR